MFVLPLLAVGCDRMGHTPTEPAETTAKAAAVSAAATNDSAVTEDGDRPAAARRLAGVRSDAKPGAASPASSAIPVAEARGNGGGNGNGNGNGGGNGGGGNGGNGNGNGGGGNGHGGDLAFTISPSTWNTNWVHADGNVQAFVRGTDAGKIDRGSIVLSADGGTLTPRSTRYAGGQVVATFSKSDAFELLGDVKPGDRKTVTLKLTVSSGADSTDKELTATVRIVGSGNGGSGGGDDDGEVDLSLSIRPDDWNTNWAHSSGQVHAFILGPGLDKVDLATVQLVGDKADAEPLKPLDVRRVGKQIVARFSKSAAYATLDDPDSGEKHTVKITLKADGKDVELSDDVHIVGP